MKSPRMLFLHRAAVPATLAAILLTFAISHASAQGRPIKIINPFPPGGTGDIIARLIADQIERARGTTMVIEDHPGAGSIIGAELVARAASDGNTLLIGTSAILINAYLHKTSYNPLASFEPIWRAASSPVAPAGSSSSVLSGRMTFMTDDKDMHPREDNRNEELDESPVPAPEAKDPDAGDDPQAD